MFGVLNSTLFIPNKSLLVVCIENKNQYNNNDNNNKHLYRANSM